MSKISTIYHTFLCLLGVPSAPSRAGTFFAGPGVMKGEAAFLGDPNWSLMAGEHVLLFFDFVRGVVAGVPLCLRFFSKVKGLPGVPTTTLLLMLGLGLDLVLAVGGHLSSQSCLALSKPNLFVTNLHNMLKHGKHTKLGLFWFGLALAWGVHGVGLPNVTLWGCVWIDNVSELLTSLIACKTVGFSCADTFNVADSVYLFWPCTLELQLIHTGLLIFAIFSDRHDRCVYPGYHGNPVND